MTKEVATVATGNGSGATAAAAIASGVAGAATDGARYWFLVNELKAHTKRFDDDSKRHKSLHRRLRYATIILTALATIAAAIAATHAAMQQWINIVMVCITATLGVLAAIEGIRKPSELWIHERTTLLALTDLQRELAYRCADSIDEGSVEDCFKRLQAVLGASGEKWSKEIAGQARPGDKT